MFISGQIPLDSTTAKLVGPGIVEQTQQVFRNLEAILIASQAQKSQAAKVTVYMTDLKEFQDMNKIYQEFFLAPYPARAVVQVAALPASCRIEMEAMVYLK